MCRALAIKTLIVLFAVLQVSCSENRKADATAENNVSVDRPEVLSIVPNVVANNNLPVVSGTAQPLVIVKFYSDSGCTNLIGVGNADESGNYSAIVQVPDDAETTVYANSFNGLYYSTCSTSFVNYVEDSSSIRPVFQSVTPTSPANENDPVVAGTAEEDATIRIYSNASCTSAVLATGVADASGAFSITVPVSDDTTTTFRAQATDLIGNVSPCSNGLQYVEDSTGFEPVMTTTNPVGPANNNSPAVRGTAERLSTVRIYTDDTCTTMVSSGTANGAGNFSITTPAVDDIENEYWGQITDRAGNVSDCSSTSVTYIEDSTGPNVPVLVSTTPDSSTDINEIQVVGTAEADSEISLYKTNDCSDAVASTATTDVNGDFSATVTVVDNEATEFWAISTDTSGNDSACSATSVTYTAYSIPEGMAYLKSTKTLTGTNFNTISEDLVEWEQSEFHSTYYEHSLTTNPEQLKVKVAGDYLVHLTVPFDSSATASTLIRNEVRVNGVATSTGLAESAFVSGSGGHRESSNHLSVLLPNLSVDDVIDISTVRSGAAATITGTASMAIEYIPGTKNIFFATATQTSDSTNLNQSTTFPLQWASVVSDSSYSHSGSNIGFNSSGNYLAHINVPVESADTNTNVKILIRINGTTLTHGIAAQGFTDSSSSSIHWSGVLPSIQVGDILTVETVLEGATGTVTTQIGKLASIYLENVGTTGVLYSAASELIGGSTNWNATGQVEWTGSVFDSSYYSVNGTNPERITLTTDGDYMVSFTAPFYSSSNNTNISTAIRLNGSTVNGAVSKSSYISSSGGHDESSNNMTYLLRRNSSAPYLDISTAREGGAGTVTTSTEAAIFIQYKPNSTTP